MEVYTHNGALVMARRPLLERFFEKIIRDPETGCWEWQGGRTAARQPYGIFPYGGHSKVILAHRFSYEHFVGLIEEGLNIDHLCGNTLCVNYNHLRAVTQRENVLSGFTRPAENSAKTVCPRGHRNYTTNNIGKRYCLTCDNERHKARYHRLKQQRLSEINTVRR
jgi:hypothetical protein